MLEGPLPAPAMVARPTGLLIPSHVPPPADVVEGILPAAVVVVEELAAVHSATRDAIARYESLCRGGSAWAAAIAADVEAATAGKPIGALAKVILDQVDAYATVVAMVGSQDARTQAVRDRHRGLLADLAEAARAVVPDLVEELGGAAGLAWLERRRGSGVLAYEFGLDLLERIRAAQGVAAWADGTDLVFSMARVAQVNLAPEVLGYWIAAGHAHAGKLDPRLWESDATAVIPADFTTDHVMDFSDVRPGTPVLTNR